MTEDDYIAMAFDLRGKGKKPFVGFLYCIGSVIAPRVPDMLDQEVPRLRNVGAIQPNFCEALIKVAGDRKAPVRVKLGASRLLAELPEAVITADEYLLVATVLIQAIPDSDVWSDFDYIPTIYGFLRINGVCGNCKGRLQSIVRNEAAARSKRMAKESIGSLLIFISQLEREQKAERWSEATHKPVNCPCRQSNKLSE